MWDPRHRHILPFEGRVRQALRLTMNLTCKDLRLALGRATDCLTPTEALVVCSIYLDSEELSVAAEVLGCSKPNVCWIRDRALRKMRKALYSRTFEDLYPETLSARDDAAVSKGLGNLSVTPRSSLPQTAVDEKRHEWEKRYD